MNTTRITDDAGVQKADIGRRLRHGLCVAALLLMAACGGGGGSSVEATPVSPATVGADGGTVTAEGAKIIVPPGAMSADATIRVAKDSTGSPVLPKWVEAAGDMLAITPHGSTFDDDVTVRLPRPAVTLKDNQRLMIAKAQPGGEWEVLGETEDKGDVLEAKVRSFSFFVPVVITYIPPPVIGAFPLPFRVTSMTIECDGRPCSVPEFYRPFPVTLTITHNSGQMPANCVDGRLEVQRFVNDVYSGSGSWAPSASEPVVRRTVNLAYANSTTVTDGGMRVQLILICTDQSTGVRSTLRQAGAFVSVTLNRSRAPTTPVVRQFPTAITKSAGDPLALSVVLAGGASFMPSGASHDYNAPTFGDQAVVFLERLAPGSLGWLSVAQVYQTGANPRPLGGLAWVWWGFDFPLGTVTAADNGAQYRVRACYQAPTATQTACNTGPVATLTVVQQSTPASFTQDPRSVLITPGQTASFSVVAAGLPAPTLQWQSRPANGSTDWADVTTGSGGTTPNYTTPVLALADNGVQYRVVATNSAGSLASPAVTASVAAGPEPATIVSQPSSLTVVEGSEALFAITARGTEALSYAWSKNGSPVQGGNGPQLRIGNVTQADAGTYSVRVQNAAGGETSNPVTLTVRAAGTPVTSAPSIVTQPAAVAVNEGNVATFAVGVSGSGPISFQWRKNGVDIPGARAAAYTLPAATLADSGNYAVAVSNSAGIVISQAATLGVALAGGTPVAQAPTILTQPGSVVVAPGMGATLAVAAQGSGPLDYQWSLNGAPLSGQTNAVLAITAASALDAGRYEVRVSNSAGSVTSTKAEVIILGAPVITAQPATLSASEGSVARFAVTATGDNLRFQWLRNNVGIDGAQDPTYATPPLRKVDSGAVYSVIVFNGAGLVFSRGALLTVTPLVPPDPPGMALLAGDIVAGGGSGAVDGIGRNARLDTPEGLAADGAGNVYVAESNSSKIARIAPNGQVTTIMALPFDAYSQPVALALAPDGSLLAAASSCGLHRITAPAGPSPSATRLPLEGNCPGSSVRGVAVDASGVIHLPVTDANSIGRVGASPVAGIYPVELWAGALNRFVPPGSSDGRGNAARFNAPRGAVFGPTGDLFVADSGNRTIRRITPQGDVVTFAGSAGAIGQVDGVGANARFVNPTDLSFDPAGNLLVLDRGDPSQYPGVAAHTFVRRITPDGVVVTLFDVSAEALPLIDPPDINGPAFVNTVRGITALSVTRIALSVGNAVLVRTLAP